MNIKLLDNTEDISNAFIDRFVMSWEEFQIKKRDWIEKMAKTNCPINFTWYEQSYMWDRMSSNIIHTSMGEALAFLREHSGSVFFMTEKGEDIYYQGKKWSILLPKQMHKFWLQELNRSGMTLIDQQDIICMIPMRFCRMTCMFLIHL